MPIFALMLASAPVSPLEMHVGLPAHPLWRRNRSLAPRPMVTSLVLGCALRNPVAKFSWVPVYATWSGALALNGRHPLSAPVAELKPAVASPGHDALVVVKRSACPT